MAQSKPKDFWLFCEAVFTFLAKKRFIEAGKMLGVLFEQAADLAVINQ